MLNNYQRYQKKIKIVNRINNMKKCGYRNCKKDISEMRRDSKFCCRNHKDYEKIYINREKSKKGGTDILYIPYEEV